MSSVGLFLSCFLKRHFPDRDVLCGSKYPLHYGHTIQGFGSMKRIKRGDRFCLLNRNESQSYLMEMRANPHMWKFLFFMLATCSDY